MTQTQDTPPPPPEDPAAPARDIGRAWLHIVAFWVGGVSSIVLNVLVLMWWLRRQTPPQGQLGFVAGLTGAAAGVFQWAAGRRASTGAYRLNLRFAWSVFAGGCYGIGFLWPVVFLAMWTSIPPARGGGKEEVSWVVVGLLAWWVVVLPAALGWAFGRLLREIRPGSGLCTRCGYDLRASAGQCPECGTLTATPR